MDLKEQAKACTLNFFELLYSANGSCVGSKHVRPIREEEICIHNGERFRR